MKSTIFTFILAALILTGCGSSAPSIVYSTEFQERQALLQAQNDTIDKISNEIATLRRNASNNESFWTPDQWRAWNRLLDQYNLAVQHKQELIDRYMASPTIQPVPTQSNQANNDNGASK